MKQTVDDTTSGPSGEAPPALSRRGFVALLTMAAAAACGGRPAASQPVAPSAPALSPVADWIPAAGLIWLVEARPRDLFADGALSLALKQILPSDRLDRFATVNGGVDPRSVNELALAGYADVTLVGVHTFVDPTRVEQAFVQRAVEVEGRAVEGRVVRTWGTVGTAREQMAIFDREGVAIERGRFGPLRAAEYFAQGRLKRARPALRTEPLAQAAALVGAAPLRAFAPGPFTGQAAQGLGGLLAGATAVAAAATPFERHERDRDRALDSALFVRFVVTGAWGADASAAAERLRATFDRLASDPLGRLLGVDRPLQGPRATSSPDALYLEAALDVATLCRGLRDATSATIEEAMRI